MLLTLLSCSHGMAALSAPWIKLSYVTPILLLTCHVFLRQLLAHRESFLQLILHGRTALYVSFMADDKRCTNRSFRGILWTCSRRQSRWKRELLAPPVTYDNGRAIVFCIFGNGRSGLQGNGSLLCKCCTRTEFAGTAVQVPFCPLSSVPVFIVWPPMLSKSNENYWH